MEPEQIAASNAYFQILIFSALTLKLAFLFVGYLIARLGFDSINIELANPTVLDAGWKEKAIRLVSFSPAIFFLFFGSFLMAWSLWTQRPLGQEFATKWSYEKNVEKTSPLNPAEIIRRRDDALHHK